MASSKFGYRKVRIQPPPKVCISKHEPDGPKTLKYQRGTVSFAHAFLPGPVSAPIALVWTMPQVFTFPQWQGFATAPDGRTYDANLAFIPGPNEWQLTIVETLSPGVWTPYVFSAPPVTDVWPYDSQLLQMRVQPGNVLVTARAIIT